MKKYIIYIIAIILIATGTGLFTYTFFNVRFFPASTSVVYYYPLTSITKLTIGAVLIVIGLLLRKREKSED